jgi:hypothetical protein
MRPARVRTRSLALTQRLADPIELSGILDGQTWRPSCVVLDQLDRNFGGIAALVDQLDCLVGHGAFRFKKSLQHVAWMERER